MTDEEGPREVPGTYAGDNTPTLEGASRSTGALKIVRVRSPPANNRLSSASRQKGPEIQTPRCSSPLVALLLRSSFVLLLLLIPLLVCYTLPVISSVTLQVLFYFLVCSSGLGLVRHVSPFVLLPRRRYCCVLKNTFWGSTFPFPLDCGLLPLSLLGHGTCNWVHRGLLWT